MLIHMFFDGTGFVSNSTKFLGDKFASKSPIPPALSDHHSVNPCFLSMRWGWWHRDLRLQSRRHILLLRWKKLLTNQGPQLIEDTKEGPGPGFWFLVFLVSGYWFLVSGFWFLVSGYWLLVSGVWSLVSGLWFLVSGCWSRSWSWSRFFSINTRFDGNIYYMSQRLKFYRKSTMIICFPVNRSKLSGSLLKSGKIGWNKDLTESYVSCFSHQALKRASYNAQLGERISEGAILFLK